MEFVRSGFGTNLATFRKERILQWPPRGILTQRGFFIVPAARARGALCPGGTRGAGAPAPPAHAPGTSSAQHRAHVHSMRDLMRDHAQPCRTRGPHVHFGVLARLTVATGLPPSFLRGGAPFDAEEATAAIEASRFGALMAFFFFAPLAAANTA